MSDTPRTEAHSYLTSRGYVVWAGFASGLEQELKECRALNRELVKQLMDLKSKHQELVEMIESVNRTDGVDNRIMQIINQKLP